jgi:hypothetical protein
MIVSSGSPPVKSSSLVSKNTSVFSRLEEGVENVLDEMGLAKQGDASLSKEGGSVWGSPLPLQWAGTEPLIAEYSEDLLEKEGDAEPDQTDADIFERGVLSSGPKIIEAILVCSILVALSGIVFIVAQAVSRKNQMRIAQDSATANLVQVTSALPGFINYQVGLAVSGRSSPEIVDLSIDPHLLSEKIKVGPPILYVSSGRNSVLHNSDGSYTVEVDVAYPDVAFKITPMANRNMEVADHSPRWFATPEHYAQGARIIDAESGELLDRIKLGLTSTMPKSCDFSGTWVISSFNYFASSSVAQNYPHVAFMLTFSKDCHLN